MKHLLKQHRHCLNELDFSTIATRTHGRSYPTHTIYNLCKLIGYSGADMSNLCREAAMGPLRSLSLETIQSITSEEVRLELLDNLSRYEKYIISFQCISISHSIYLFLSLSG